MRFKTVIYVARHDGEAIFNKEDFVEVTVFEENIHHYRLVRHCDCDVRGYHDDEDAELNLKNVLEIECFSHGELTAEIIISEQLILHLEDSVSGNDARFNIYIKKDHLRFGRLVFLTPGDLD